MQSFPCHTYCSVHFGVGHVLGDATTRDIDIPMKLGAGELVSTGLLCPLNVIFSRPYN